MKDKNEGSFGVMELMIMDSQVINIASYGCNSD